VQSLSRFSEKLVLLGAHAHADSMATRHTNIGPALIFQRLWQSCSIDQVLAALLQDRRFEFADQPALTGSRTRQPQQWHERRQHPKSGATRRH
jgi:hypothetical protein